LSGYDAVSYFTDGRPEKGSDAFWYAYDDAIYLFRNAEHQALFAAEPERYAPQYAGFCAGGISDGYKTEPDPEAWLIVSGKLYVFQLKEKVEDFKRDLSFIKKADVNWPGLRDAPVR
jgi:YHS domain-containing protein